MRVPRFLGVVLVVVSVAASTGACRATNDNTGVEQTSTPTIPTKEMQIDPMPSGQWKAAGYLCKIITGEVVSELFNKPPLEAEHVEESHPGPDYCTYGLAQPDDHGHKLAVVTVEVVEYSPEGWEELVTTLTKDASNVTKFKIEGVDEALYSGQAWVRKDNLVATASGFDADEPLDEDQLVRLAAMAVMVVHDS